MIISNFTFGDIEIRLQKVSSDKKNLGYFDEYAKLGELKDEQDIEHTRYIVPEDTFYAFEIVFRKNFDFHESRNILVHIIDEASGQRLCNAILNKPGLYTTLERDHVFLFENPSETTYIVKDGKRFQNAKFSFHSLKSDDDLENAENEDSVKVAVFVVKVLIGNKIGTVPRFEDDVRVETEIYRAAKDASAEQRVPNNAISESGAIDQKSFSKFGVTHQLSLSEGSFTPLTPPKLTTTSVSGSWIAEVRFVCRSQSYLEEKSIAKTPIPLEFQPWYFLDEGQRQTCFKKLQEHDKHECYRIKLRQAGRDANYKLIGKEHYDAVVNVYRSWFHCFKRERQSVFEQLQARRKFIDVGLLPPEDRPETKEKENKFLKSLSQEPQVQVKEEKIDQSPILRPSTPTSTSNEGNLDNPTTQNSKPSMPDVIVIEDTPPPPTRPDPSWSQAAREKEVYAQLASHRQSKRKINPAEQPASAKRIKTEPGLQLTDLEVDEDIELQLLKKEAEEEEEELRQAQKIAELMYKRKERNAKIKAMEARKSGTPFRN